MEGSRRWGTFLGGRRVAGAVSAGVVIGAAALLGFSTLAGAAPSRRSGRTHGSRPSCAARGNVRVHHNSWSVAERTLAPHGARVINLCQYAGANSDARYKLVGNHLVRSQRTRHQIISRLDALRPFHHFHGHPPGCPKSEGQEVVATLVYKGGHQVTIAVDLAGCTYARNGDVTRPLFNTTAGSRLEKQLRRLTRRK